MMGWIGAIGSLGRTVGPIIAGYIFQLGNFYTFLFSAGCVAVSVILIVSFRKFIV